MKILSYLSSEAQTLNSAHLYKQIKLYFHIFSLTRFDYILAENNFHICDRSNTLTQYIYNMRGAKGPTDYNKSTEEMNRK